MLMPISISYAQLVPPGLRASSAGKEAMETQLAAFDSITLAEMEGVALLDRRESKYILRENTLRTVLRELKPFYSVLEVQGHRLNHYRTLYFDTSDFALYRRHHAGALDRYKVRSREYVDSQCAFLEVKHKTNKQRTVKHRIQTPRLVTTLAKGEARFLSDTCPYEVEELAPSLWNTYVRITLVHKTCAERVTLDTNLGFTWSGWQASLPGIAIAEVKQEVCAHGSDFVRLMREYHVRSTGFSKYCMGVSSLYPGIKSNRFRAKHRLVAKLMQGGADDIH